MCRLPVAAKVISKLVVGIVLQWSDYVVSSQVVMWMGPDWCHMSAVPRTSCAQSRVLPTCDSVLHALVTTWRTSGEQGVSGRQARPLLS